MPARNYFPSDWVNAMGLDNLNYLLSEIGKALVELRKDANIFPEAGSPLLFQSFRETPYNSVKICVLGQDPYHDGSFNGLAFGNGPKVGDIPEDISPSLKNILKEVKRTELIDANPSLYSWANQGVLLINTAHSVIEGMPGSHLELWRPFTDLVIQALNTRPDLIWMLWGSKAQVYIPQINPTHSILKVGHPSPLNTTHPFVGCNCFKDCNNLLKKKRLESILWC